MLIPIRLMLVLAGIGLAAQAEAQTTLLACDFDHPRPFACREHDGGTHVPNVRRGEGACAKPMPFWTLTAHASGGRNDGPYARYQWCDYDEAPAGITSAQSGLHGAGITYAPAAGWQPTDTYYFRMRIFFENGIIRHRSAPNSETHHHFKFALFHMGVFDGDERAIIFFSPGNVDPAVGGSGFGGRCNGRATTHVCVSIQRNVHHYSEAAYALVPVGEWVDLQFAWRHGESPFVKLWRNNDNEAKPTAEDTKFDSPWRFAARGYDHGYQIMDMANEGTAVDGGPFAYRLMNVEFGLGFRSDWHKGGPSPAKGGR